MKTRGKQAICWKLSCLLLLTVTSGCDKLSAPQALAQVGSTTEISTTTSELSTTSTEAKPATKTEEKSVPHKTVIRQPPPVKGAVFRVSVSGENSTSYEGYLKCASCHSLRPANPANATSTHMDEFHQGLLFAHGKLSCISCHNPGDNYSSLRLADGQSIPYEESMRLCAQCHGPQYRDYEHGSHGGMTGYWDLKRGERVRNHCQHCHDPHVPNYPKFYPAAAPQDRFQPSHSNKGAGHED